MKIEDKGDPSKRAKLPLNEFADHFGADLYFDYEPYDDYQILITVQLYVEENPMPFIGKCYTHHADLDSKISAIFSLVKNIERYLITDKSVKYTWNSVEICTDAVIEELRKAEKENKK